MSLENDVAQLKEADVFKPASKREADARKHLTGSLWVSLRIVRAKTYEEALHKVEFNEFEEDHYLCDSIWEADAVRVAGRKITEAHDVFKAASKEEAAKRQKEYKRNPENFVDFAWRDELNTIIADYKERSAEPLDGDEVDNLIENLRAKINYLEGNITEEEYAEGVFRNPPAR